MALSDIPSDNLPAAVQLLLEEFVEKVAPILEWLSWLLGGIFGLYLILVLVRLYFERKKVKMLKELHGDVEFLKSRSLSEPELERLRVILRGYGSEKKQVGKKKKPIKKSGIRKSRGTRKKK